MVAMGHSSGSALTVGRFTGREPLGFGAGDNNWYRFVANGPTDKTDPSGLTFVGDVTIGVTAPALVAYMACIMPYLEYAHSTMNDGPGNDKLKHCYVSCAASRGCWKFIAFVAGEFKELTDLARDGVLDDLLVGAGGEFTPEQMQAVQNFLGDSAANKYGRDAARWESNIPLAGWIGCTVRTTCEKLCREGRANY